MDHHLLFLLELLVSFIDPLVDPIVKLVSHHSINDISQVAAREFLDFFLNGQEVEDLRMLSSILKDSLNFEALVLWDHDDFELIVLHDPLLACRQVS